MTVTVTRVVIGVAGATAIMLAGRSVLFSQGSICGMQKNDAPLAFCETFDHPFPVTNRSGQLDGTLWGVSRADANDGYGSFAEGWSGSTLVGCNGNQPAQPDGTDVIVCNGQLRESLDDDHGVSSLAMYPKQPFDFAGRTGTVAFDVTNDNHGNHSFWPEFWLTDQPVPAPFQHGGPPCDFCSLPRNGLGISFAASWPAGQGNCAAQYPNDRHWIVESMVTVQNYIPHEITWLDSSGTMTPLDCVSSPSSANGPLNHIEIRISQTQIDVWASDAGKTALKHMTSVNLASLGMTLNFTRGLVWIEDAHYNAAKSDAPGDAIPGNPNVHTFTWDNVAFDGPAPYRDLSLDVPDALTVAGQTGDGYSLLNLGWYSNPSSFGGAAVKLKTLPVAQANIDAAIAANRGALLMFNFTPQNPVNTFFYTINGHAESAPTPFAPAVVRDHSVALPVPLTDLVAGPQNITLWADQDMIVLNVNIVLIAAATVPGRVPPSAPTNLRIQ